MGRQSSRASLLKDGQRLADTAICGDSSGGGLAAAVIPGAEGQTEPGSRRVNWVWYWNVPEHALSELMTARDGIVRDLSVPPGQVRPELIERQNAIAETLFCPPFLALWRATREPFVQPILDLAVPRMRQDRVAIVGDAAFIPRPHTAASTSKAVTNALRWAQLLVPQKAADGLDAGWGPPLAANSDPNAQWRLADHPIAIVPRDEAIPWAQLAEVSRSPAIGCPTKTIKRADS